nr:hypothetical protein CFP56_52770 [Quercus suber]
MIKEEGDWSTKSRFGRRHERLVYLRPSWSSGVRMINAGSGSAKALDGRARRGDRRLNPGPWNPTRLDGPQT